MKTEPKAVLSVEKELPYTPDRKICRDYYSLKEI